MDEHIINKILLFRKPHPVALLIKKHHYIYEMGNSFNQYDWYDWYFGLNGFHINCPTTYCSVCYRKEISTHRWTWRSKYYSVFDHNGIQLTHPSKWICKGCDQYQQYERCQKRFNEFQNSINNCTQYMNYATLAIGLFGTIVGLIGILAKIELRIFNY